MVILKLLWVKYQENLIKFAILSKRELNKKNISGSVHIHAFVRIHMQQ